MRFLDDECLNPFFNFYQFFCWCWKTIGTPIPNRQLWNNHHTKRLDSDSTPSFIVEMPYCNLTSHLEDTPTRVLIRWWPECWRKVWKMTSNFSNHKTEIWNSCTVTISMSNGEDPTIFSQYFWPFEGVTIQNFYQRFAFFPWSLIRAILQHNVSQTSVCVPGSGMRSCQVQIVIKP